MELVVWKEFNQRFEAESAMERLKANAIDAILISDDGGGTRPHTGLATGYKLKINKKDIKKAQDIQ